MDDQELVARIRAGDLDAASELLSRYQDVSYAVALRLLGNSADAEDIAQEALVRAYTHISDLEQGASFPGWLRRITVNLSLNLLRRQGQLSFESLDAGRRTDGSPARDFSDTRELTPEDAALKNALRTEVEGLLEQLPPANRVAVVLRDMYDYDVSQIAELQRCGVSAAKMRIMRGRASLRQLLVEKGLAKNAN